MVQTVISYGISKYRLFVIITLRNQYHENSRLATIWILSGLFVVVGYEHLRNSMQFIIDAMDQTLALRAPQLNIPGLVVYEPVAH